MNVLLFPGFLDDTWSSIEERYLWLDPALRETGSCQWLVPMHVGAPEPRYAAELRKTGAHLVFADLRPRRLLANAIRIARILKANRIDLVYTHFGPLRYQVEAVAHLLGIRVVRGEHNFAFHPDRRLRFAKRLFWRWAVDWFVPVSQAVAAHLEQAGVMEGNVSVVYDGFDLDRYPEPAMAESHAHLLRELGVDGQPRLLACVAKLHPAKQQHLLVEMLAHLHDRSALLLLAGEVADGNYAETLRNLALRLGVAHRIRFLGYRRDVARLMDAAHVTFLPSKVEGLGNVVVESCIMGTPVIAADLPAIREIIENGRSGYLVEGDSPARYAELADRLLLDDALRRGMGAAARSKVAAKFARPVFVQHSVAALQAALKGGRHP